MTWPGGEHSRGLLLDFTSGADRCSGPLSLPPPWARPLFAHQLRHNVRPKGPCDTASLVLSSSCSESVSVSKPLKNKSRAVCSVWTISRSLQRERLEAQQMEPCGPGRGREGTRQAAWAAREDAAAPPEESRSPTSPRPSGRAEAP